MLFWLPISHKVQYYSLIDRDTKEREYVAMERTSGLKNGQPRVSTRMDRWIMALMNLFPSQTAENDVYAIWGLIWVYHSSPLQTHWNSAIWQKKTMKCWKHALKNNISQSGKTDNQDLWSAMIFKQPYVIVVDRINHWDGVVFNSMYFLWFSVKEN